MALTKTPSEPAFDPNAPPTGATGSAPPPPADAPPPTTNPATLLPDPDADPDKAWQDYGVQAINILYPHARNGVDFAWGRTEPGGDAMLLDWSDKLAPPDEGKIEEVARKLAEQNPYGPNYKPGPSLAGRPITNAPDEVQPKPQY